MQATKRRVDDRGWFSEIFHQERLRDIGITCRFVQDNQSSSKRAGTLRGLHFQLPAAQAKLVTVVKGRILDVATTRLADLWSACFDRTILRNRAPGLENDVLVMYK